jgi:hypothetical protein
MHAFWVFCGVFAVVGVVFARAVTRPAMDSRTFAVTVALVGGLFLLLPSLFLTFFTRKSVRAACTIAGAQPRSPGRPASVVLLAAWVLLGAVGSLPGLLHPSAVVFGVIIQGAIGSLFMLTNIVVSAWVTWAVWQRRRAGWRAALVLFSFWALSGIVSFVRWDPRSLTAAMMNGESSAVGVYDSMPGLGLFLRIMVAVMAVLSMVLVLYTKRHFTEPAAAPPHTTA